jgi:hypothetical protein
LDTKENLNRKFTVFYGACGTVNEMDECVKPADDETPEDTEQDSKVWLPPEVSRGPIARGLFYNAIRYSALSLVDCPPFFEGEYGYLSQLLEWHQQYPPTEQEQNRTDRACRYWQGNRNPFIDYPGLVAKFFGQPDTIPSGTISYSNCTQATEAPTATPNACSGITPGDVVVFGFNSVDPDQILFYPLFAVEAEVDYLYVTNQPWDGTKILDTAGGTLAIKVPEEGFNQGKVFAYGIVQDNITLVEYNHTGPNQFDLNPDGDHILIYCMNADNQPHFINAITYQVGWAEEGLANYTTGTSALPKRLDPLGSVALGEFSNWYYNGTRTGSADVLIPAFSNASSWVGSDIPYNLPSGAMERNVMRSLLVSAAIGLVVMLW